MNECSILIFLIGYIYTPNIIKRKSEKATGKQEFQVLLMWVYIAPPTVPCQSEA